MDSTPSVYKKQIERNGRTYTVIDSMKGTDFLDQWYSSNPDEVLARETAEREAMDDSTTSKQ
jgi:large subunit ribosomal protein L41